MFSLNLVPRLKFALRCACSASLAFELALALGLTHPVWAAMSSLIVCQEHLHATRHSIIGRIAGTIIGVTIACLVGQIGFLSEEGVAAQTALATGLCALIAKGWTAGRVCLWTAPLVLLTVPPGGSIDHVGLIRGSEVILGALVGGLVHLAGHYLMKRWVGLPAKLSAPH